MTDPYAAFSSADADPYASFSSAENKPRNNLRPADAQKAVKDAQANLERQISGKSPQEQAAARAKFNANPTIKDLMKVGAKEEPTTIGQLFKSTKQRGAAAVKGVTGIFDAAMGGATGLEQLVTQGLGKGGGAALDAVGLDGAADWWRQGAASADEQLARTPTIRSGVEKVVAPPTDTAGKIADFATEFVAGAAVPIPGAKQKPSFKLSEVAKGTSPEQIAARETVEAGAANKIPIMTTDVVPPKTFVGKTAQRLGEIVPWAGTGGQRAEQQVARQKSIGEFATGAGASEQSLGNVAGDLTKVRGEELSRLKGIKDQVIDAIEGNVPTDRTVSAIDDQIAELEKVGTDAGRSVIAKLKDWRQAVQSKDLRTIETIRKEMGEAFSAPEMASVRSTGEKALNAIYDPMRAEMGTFIRNRSGQEALEKWTGANEELAAMAGELKDGKFARTLKTADMTPESVSTMLFSNEPSAVTRLYENLSPVGQQKARAAILQRAIDKAGGIENISPEKFMGEIGRLKSSVGVVFEGEGKAALNGLMRALKATGRAGTANVNPNTGVSNFPVIAGYSLGTLLGPLAIPAGAATGLLARAYESPAVRDLLIGLSKTKPGTKAETDILRRLTPALAVATNSANDNVGVAAAASDGKENQEEQQ